MEGEHLNLVLNLLRVVSDERLAVVGWPLVVLADFFYLCWLLTNAFFLTSSIMLEPLHLNASDQARQERYALVLSAIEQLIDGEDWISAMATVCCELHHAFDFYHWTGFYRQVQPGQLAVGPYQGGHGCLRIPFSRGVCGAAAREARTQLVPDVHAFADHIACSSTTQSEIVVPILTPSNKVLAVLDVDSDVPAAFNQVDQDALERLARKLGTLYAHELIEGAQ